MKEKIIGHFGQILHETYGSTEASIVSDMRPADQLRKQACVGQAFPGTEIEIRRDDGSLCEPDEVGELIANHIETTDREACKMKFYDRSKESKLSYRISKRENEFELLMHVSERVTGYTLKDINV